MAVSVDSNTTHGWLVWLSAFWRWPVTAIGIAGLIVGGAIGWWVNKPPARWVHFFGLRAEYHLGSTAIHVTGDYEVVRSCRDSAGERGEVRWTMAAIATDGQIALYGPASPPPDLSLGEHSYEDTIELREPIIADSWQVYITVQCALQGFYTVISPIATLRISKEPGI